MKESITRYQFLSLVILFEFGSSIIVGLGFEAKQNAWIVILLSMIGGVLLYWLFTRFVTAYPDTPFPQVLQKLAGPYLGYILIWMYIAYFLYIAARVLRDFTMLTAQTILHETPLLAVSLLFMFVVCFACYLGIEVIARTSELFLPFALLMGGLFLMFVFIMDLPKVHHLQPFFNQDIGEILSFVFPTGITFPFGELIVFAIIFPHLEHPLKSFRYGVMGILISGTILLIISVTILMVLGPAIAMRSVVPLLDTISLVNLQGFIQRMDPIVIIIMVITGFFKITIFFYAAIAMLQYLFRLPRTQSKGLIGFMGILVVILSILISPNFVEHIKEGLDIVPLYVHVPFQMIIPSILFVLLLIKNRKNTA
ncbi:spore gernimation protein KB [Pontibacillus chungwhensis BH030062]|uniref:Spore gernimation protein KB n=1 Tax=Pontibacillus chungwhensis BH030062 TaxID=1385513 RepID=A0A0A2VBX4_9BACI|nr:endospore germination permease [Pontibacillus chungwhensis]KGP91170.1 spore gernimation protein KB [Pontibacillus chungwhensis BH030062]